MKTSLCKNLAAKLVVIMSLAFVGCAAPEAADEQETGGILSVDVKSGTALSNDVAMQKLMAYCSQDSFSTYLNSVAGTFSFNSGYAEHPDAGYDAQVVSKVGDDGEQGLYLGRGNMYSPNGMGMDPPRSRVDELVKGACRVVIGSLQKAGASAGERSSVESCSYPKIEVSEGGSANGKAARGSVNRQGCLVAKMQNAQLRNTSEVAFCQGAIVFNFWTKTNVASESSWILQRSAATVAANN